MNNASLGVSLTTKIWLVCIFSLLIILFSACDTKNKTNKEPKEFEEQMGNSNNGFNELWNIDFDDIWKIEDENSFIIAIFGWLCKKCNYGEEIKKLSHAEKAVYIVIELEGEINNGGFSQYLYNNCGNFANETENFLREIGADKTADICKKAFTALGDEIPEEWELRQEKLENMITDKVDEILSECDNEFYSYPDNLVKLICEFIATNRNQFTRN